MVFHKTFSKYFIQDSTLKDYLINHGNFSVFENTRKNLYNIDWRNYAQLTGLPPDNDAALKEHYIRTGQFLRYEIRFKPQKVSEYKKYLKSIAIVSGQTTAGSKTGAGFLYRNFNRPDEIYLITTNHLLSKENLESFKALFEVVDQTNEIISTTAEFKVIGRDIYTDIIVSMFDPNLFYNKTFGVDLRSYEPLSIDIESEISEGDKINIIGSIGSLDNKTLITGQIMDPHFNGSFITGAYSVPECLLIDVNVSTGLSGAPVFLEKNNKFSLVGMVILCFSVGDNGQYCVSLIGFTLEVIINNYQKL